MNGYLADISGSDESSHEVRILSAKRSKIEETGKVQRFSIKFSRKRRAPGSTFVKAPIKSPIHPDINYHMTKRVFSKDYPDAMMVVGTRSDCNRTKAVSSPMQQLPIPAASASAGPPTGVPFQQNPISSELQQTSTIIPCERMTATFSKRRRRLEEGLALTQTPRYVNHCRLFEANIKCLHNFVCFLRLLIEAESPHRVVHANAAFTQSVVGTLSNTQRWFERQTSSNIPKTRSLKKALRDIIPNRDVHLVLYPVTGSEKVSHYLIETQDESRKKRRRTKYDEAHRAIG